MNKSQIAALVRTGVVKESFHSEEYGDFDVNAMRVAAAAGQYGEPFCTPIYKELIEFISKNRDYDLDRIKEIQKSPDILNDPVMVVGIDDGHCVIDGTHRILARFANRVFNFYFYLCPIEKAIRPTGNQFTTDLGWGRLEILPDGTVKPRKR